MRTKILAGLAASAAVLAFAAPAFAGTGSGTPTTGLTDGQAVTVTWSGFAAGAKIFISQCGASVNNPIFNPSGYCNGDTQVLASGASGTATIPVVVGADPNGLAYACGTTTDPANQPLIQADGSCFIRVTELSNQNVTGQFEFPISFSTVAPTTVAPTTVAPTTVAPTTIPPTTVAPGTTVAPTTTIVDPVVPEAPYAVLLPLGAIGALGAGIFLSRRKSVA